MAKKLTSDQRDLAGRPEYVAMAYQLAAIASRRHRSASYPDLVGAALLGLCHAARRFDEARGVRFATYAVRVVRGFILDHLREEMPLGFRRADYGARSRGVEVPVSVSVSDRHDPDRTGGMPISDALESSEEPVDWGMELADEAAAALRSLGSKRKAAIVRMFYLDPATVGNAAAVGARFGLTAPAVWQVLREARKFARS